MALTAAERRLRDAQAELAAAEQAVMDFGGQVPLPDSLDVDPSDSVSDKLVDDLILDHLPLQWLLVHRSMYMWLEERNLTFVEKETSHPLLYSWRCIQDRQ